MGDVVFVELPKIGASVAQNGQIAVVESVKAASEIYAPVTGTVTAVFTVSLSASSILPVTANYATADGTATAGSNDYVPIFGTLTFAPGKTTMTISVVIKPDRKKDADERPSSLTSAGRSTPLCWTTRGSASS